MNHEPGPKFSIIITCKGRLRHLMQSLPTAVLFPNSEVILVDYDCPEKSGEWAKSQHPQTNVIFFKNKPIFNKPEALNAGIKQAKAEWLFFLDADVMIHPDLYAHLTSALKPRTYHRPLPMKKEIWGTFICEKSTALKLEGFDEVVHGYGGEDDDFYFRIRRLGSEPVPFPAEFLTEIPHDDHQRSRYYDLKNISISQRINSLYVAAKLDLENLLRRNLPLETRQSIYQQVNTSILNSTPTQTEILIEIDVPYAKHTPPIQAGWRLSRKLIFKLEPYNNQ